MFSSDGRWVAYRSSDAGQEQLYVRPYPGPGGRQLVSVGNGGEPVWSRDGQELFFRESNRLMVVSIEGGETFSAGTPRVLFEGYDVRGASNYDVAPGGERFVMVQSDSADTPSDQGQVVVVQNWLEELKRLVPVD